MTPSIALSLLITLALALAGLWAGARVTLLEQLADKREREEDSR